MYANSFKCLGGGGAEAWGALQGVGGAHQVHPALPPGKGPTSWRGLRVAGAPSSLGYSGSRMRLSYTCRVTASASGLTGRGRPGFLGQHTGHHLQIAPCLFCVPTPVRTRFVHPFQPLLIHWSLIHCKGLEGRTPDCLASSSPCTSPRELARMRGVREGSRRPAEAQGPSRPLALQRCSCINEESSDWAPKQPGEGPTLCPFYSGETWGSGILRKLPGSWFREAVCLLAPPAAGSPVWGLPPGMCWLWALISWGPRHG